MCDSPRADATRFLLPFSQIHSSTRNRVKCGVNVRLLKSNGRRDREGPSQRDAGQQRAAITFLKSTSKRNHSVGASHTSAIKHNTPLGEPPSSAWRVLRGCGGTIGFEDEAGALGGRRCSIMQIAALLHLEGAEKCCL